MTLVVIDAVGLTPRALEHMPRLRGSPATASRRGSTPCCPPSPARVQSTLPHRARRRPTTGSSATAGTSATSARCFLWRQHNALVQGEKVWETARRAKPGFRAANVCWWYAMGATTDFTVTPRPIYHADGAQVARLLHAIRPSCTTG